MATRLLAANFIVYLLVSATYLALWLALGTENNIHYTTLWAILEYVCMPASGWELMMHPWALFTSMFLHQSFLHLLSNMVWLYLFGTIVGDLIGNRRVFPLYLLGGLAGNITFILSAQFLPGIGTHALGASAAVMALSGAALILAPDYRVMLMLLGEIRLKYIVLVMVLLDLLGFANQDNTGGHIAHLGGLMMGILFVFRLRDGKDMAEPVNAILDYAVGLFAPNQRRPRKNRKKPQMAFKGTGSSKAPQHRTDNIDQSFQEKLDVILDKIKKEGYDQLTAEEKEFLFLASKK
ncbi:MAG: rhomboid family intramembrane serine protease [Lewinellaceae bacterium]|nr:rhomboid family intramembrane serine protease [Lewinellaceae bacterium]